MIFHRQAPTSVAKIIRLSIILISIIPLPIVVATWRPKTRNAENSKKAAHSTAWRGVRTRVDTTVAIAFAES